MRFLLLPIALLFSVSTAPAQTFADSAFALSARLPLDAKVRIGTLPNGIRYYIRTNQKPEKRAELRLVVNAGSVQEKADQRGYAHFVEHTAFNGTRNFAKNDLIAYLQSIGVRFGADLNAYTSFDETVYILPVPTDTPRIVEQAFTILEDWAHGQIFDSTEVINERGVVLEEWRGSKGASERMLQQWLPIALRNSLYAQRLPIGTDTSIRRATPGRLRPFYRDWYRPDLMSVIAVGDFDPARIETLIRRHFSRIRPNPAGPRRTATPIPANQRPLIAIASDAEATSTDVTLMFKLPAQATRTVADYRRDLAGRLYLQMLNARLSEITQRPNAPFIGASASKGGFVGREIAPFTLGAAVQDGGVERGLEALLVEARRVDQFGFLQSELDRAKSNMLRSYELAHAERDKSPSVVYAEEYIRNYLEGEAIPGIEWEYAAVQRLLPTISLADVNRLAANWITDENRVIIVGAPRKEGVPLPTEASLLAAIGRAGSAPVVAYTESVSSDALVASLRPAGSIVARRALPVGVTEWRLSNGARVLVKPTDFKADEILFSAYSPGGTAMAADSMFMSAALATQIMAISGSGTFNRVDLDKKLAGKAARVSPTMGELTEGLTGSASPKDLETLFELIYLSFTAPRLDSVAYAAFAQNVTPFLLNRGAAPEAVFSDTVQVTLAQNDFRARPISTTTFAEVDAAEALAFYRDRFADASDFTFLFVGTVDTLALIPLVEKYIASLPAVQRKDDPKSTTRGPPRGVVQRTVRKGVEQKATTLLVFSGPCTYTPEERFALRMLNETMQLRLDASLREKLGGTYSPGVSGGCSRAPRQEYMIQVSFESSPENVETLVGAVFGIIDSLKTHGPLPADVEKAREQVARSREVEVKTNAYWRLNIAARDQAGEDIGGLLEGYDAMVRGLTAARIQAAARKYLDTANYARFVLLPEK